MKMKQLNARFTCKKCYLPFFCCYVTNSVQIILLMLVVTSGLHNCWPDEKIPGRYLIFGGTGMMMKQGWVFEDQMFLNGWVWASKMFLNGWVLKRKMFLKGSDKPKMFLQGSNFPKFSPAAPTFPKIYTKSILRITMMLLNGSLFGKMFLNGWVLQLKMFLNGWVFGAQMFLNGWVSKSQESSYP